MSKKEVKCQFEQSSREIMNKLSKCENEKTKNIVLSGNQFCRDVCFSKCNFLLDLAYLWFPVQKSFFTRNEIPTLKNKKNMKMVLKIELELWNLDRSQIFMQTDCNSNFIKIGRQKQSQIQFILEKMNFYLFFLSFAMSE